MDGRVSITTDGGVLKYQPPTTSMTMITSIPPVSPSSTTSTVLPSSTVALNTLEDQSQNTGGLFSGSG